MRTLCDFANGKTPNYFIHPILRAILIHFWLAYDHPFVDGNGGTARALFYWAVLNCISYIEKKGFIRRSKKGNAFVFSLKTKA